MTKKKIVFAGAGQMGKAALRLVNPEHYTVEAFADNSPALQGTLYCGLPVISAAEAVAMAPDGIFVAVAGKERAAQLHRQFRDLGYTGPIEQLCDYAQKLDIRGAVAELLAGQIAAVPGAIAELGVYKGEFSAHLNRLLPERTLYLFDTFEGFDARDVSAEQGEGYSRASEGDFADTSVELVLAKLTTPEKAIVRKGYFPATADGLEDQFALVSLDADLYEPTLQGLRWFYPRMNPGGVILLHDYHNTRFAGVKAAVEQFRAENGPLLLAPVADLHGSIMLLKPY